MSAASIADTEVADPLRALRRRMIREVEWFLEGRIGRSDPREAELSPTNLDWPVRSAVRGASWYDGRGGKPWLLRGENVPC